MLSNLQPELATVVVTRARAISTCWRPLIQSYKSKSTSAKRIRMLKYCQRQNLMWSHISCFLSIWHVSSKFLQIQIYPISDSHCFLQNISKLKFAVFHCILCKFLPVKIKLMPCFQYLLSKSLLVHMSLHLIQICLKFNQASIQYQIVQLSLFALVELWISF